MNRPILAIYGVVLVLFALLIGFTSRWTVFEADALRKNPLNQRELLETLKIPRGVIRAADGTVLARSRPVGSGELRTYTRVYPPAANPFAHALGYSFARTGQAGLERERNDELTGKNSEVGTIVDQLTGKKQVGNDLYTTLDPKAQQAALNGLAGRKGAVVALDPQTGAIKVMASVPGYNPNDIGDPGKFTQLNRDPNAPLKEEMARARWSQAPDDDAARMYVEAMARLEAAGLEQYEISNVARRGRRSRHNLKYWTDGEWIGFGPGAHSTRDGARWKNIPSTEEYIDRIAAGGPAAVDRRRMTPDERLGDALFTALRLVDGIDENAIQTRYGVDVWRRYGADLAPFIEVGCLRRDGARLSLTRQGMLVAHEIMSVFV